jgi:hypothetical protein
MIGVEEEKEGLARGKWKRVVMVTTSAVVSMATTMETSTITIANNDGPG